MAEPKKKISRARRIINRTEKWARKRHAPDPIPYKVSGRRIYIIPTRFGLIYALATFALLLGSMNYSNALAFFLTFAMAAIGFVAMHLTNSNLAGIILEPAVAEPVFATEPAILKIALSQTGKKIHPEVLVTHNEANSSDQKVLVDANSTHASIVMPTHKRGYIELDYCYVSTRFPLNLFYAWTAVFQPIRCLVYPQAAESAPEVYGEESTSDSKKSAQKMGLDDFAGLREYQWQDSPQHIAWKSYASHDKLLVKQFHETVAKTVWFDIEALDDPDQEARLSQLCRMVLDADAAQQNYGLKLGTLAIPPSSGSQHKHNCLRALALYNSEQIA